MIKESWFLIIVTLLSYKLPSSATQNIIPYRHPTEIVRPKDPSEYSRQRGLENLKADSIVPYSNNVFKLRPLVYSYHPTVTNANLILAKEFSNLLFCFWSSILGLFQYILCLLRDYIAFHLESSLERRQELLEYNRMHNEDRRRLSEEKKAERSQAIQNVLSCCHQMSRSIWFHYFHSKAFNTLAPPSIVRPNLFDSFNFIKNKFWPEQKSKQEAKISFPWFKFGK